jgi:hypothetical protein
MGIKLTPGFPFDIIQYHPQGNLMKKIYSLAFCLALMFTANSSLAADGSSGCGPAWYLLTKNSIVSSFLRGVTNAILSPVVTLGMTFGTSNCSKHTLVQREKRSVHLATVGFEKLRQDIAEGDGEFLNAYAKTFNCSDSSIAVFKTSLQQNYDRIFSGESTPADVVDRTKALMNGNAVLVYNCDAA